jgi:Domain of unknown function (DUF1918)
MAHTASAFRGHTGDLVVIEGHRVGQGRRLGEILEVLGEPGQAHVGPVPPKKESTGAPPARLKPGSVERFWGYLGAPVGRQSAAGRHCARPERARRHRRGWRFHARPGPVVGVPAIVQHLRKRPVDDSSICRARSFSVVWALLAPSSRSGQATLDASSRPRRLLSAVLLRGHLSDQWTVGLCLNGKWRGGLKTHSAYPRNGGGRSWRCGRRSRTS